VTAESFTVRQLLRLRHYVSVSLTDCSREVKKGLKRDASKGTRKSKHQVPFPAYVTFFLAQSAKKFQTFYA